MAPEDFAARRVQKTIKYYSEGNLGVCPAAQRECGRRFRTSRKG